MTMAIDTQISPREPPFMAEEQNQRKQKIQEGRERFKGLNIAKQSNSDPPAAGDLMGPERTIEIHLDD